jgi:hypothetical protein
VLNLSFRLRIKVSAKNPARTQSRGTLCETEVIPIYYLKNDKSDIVFNEEEFNYGEQSSDNRIMGFFESVPILVEN